MIEIAIELVMSALVVYQVLYRGPRVLGGSTVSERDEEMAIHMREARAGSDSRGACRACAGLGTMVMTQRTCERCEGSGNEPPPVERQAVEVGDPGEPDPMRERPTVLVNAMAHAESQANPYTGALVDAFEARGEQLAGAHQRIGYLRAYAAQLETEVLLLIAEGLYDDSRPLHKLWHELTGSERANWIERARRTRRAQRIIIDGALDRTF